MEISLFSRGIKLPRRRVAERVGVAPVPARVVLALQQGAEDAAEPAVEQGDEVQRGQVVANGAGGGAGLHSPVAGRVAGIEELVLADGSTGRALIIEAGEGDDAEREADPEPLKRSAEELLERIRRAGVFRGGAEPRALATVIDEALASRGHIPATGSSVARPVRHVAVRCTDVDPHLSSLETLAAEVDGDLDDLVLGIEVLLLITGAEQAHMVLDRKQHLPGLEKLADERDWAVVRVDSRSYPAASDALVGRSVLGKEPPVAFQRVHESGLLLVDVDTVLDVVGAVRDGTPVTERLLTIVDHRGEARVLRAPIGSSLQEIAGGSESGEPGKVVVGGPMQGVAAPGLDVPVTKGLAGLTLIPREQVTLSTNDLCVSCGLCAMVCPMRLTPGMLSRYCEFAKWEEAEEAHLFTCIECGCCAYVCPAGRSMVQLLVHGKSEVLARRRSA